MQPEDFARIGHMLDAAAKIAAWVEDVDKASFGDNELLQAAIAYEIQIIGEAAYHLTDEFKQQSPEIPWHKITGMRHRLVHDYFDIDVDVVWEVAIARLPELSEQLATYAPETDE